MLVFGEKCDPFLQDKDFYARGKSQKSAFSIERHYKMGFKLYKIGVFEVRYLENDNGDPSPLLLHFLIEGVKINNIGKYE